jgi:hypothetical protein
MPGTLDAIKEKNLIFISAQPDCVYFHWQVELYLYQFSKCGIRDHCYVLFGYNDNPSDYALDLAKKYKGRIFFYKDERNPDEKVYIPSIRPHILKKFFKDYPELGKNVFYHDSDIFIVKLPDFELMLNDDIGYLSDTVGYIGYNYLADCSKRYKDRHTHLQDLDLVKKMCECFDISEELVKDNQLNSGGAQYLLKNIDSTFWEDVEKNTNKLYKMFKIYESAYPIDHHVQSWATDMWGVLWTYWKCGKKTVLHKDLEFSWAMNPSSEYYNKKIFHLAGVTEENRLTGNFPGKEKFLKSRYMNTNVLVDYYNNPTIFDKIDEASASNEYINILKEYVDGPFFDLKRFGICSKFFLRSKDPWSDVYKEDDSVQIGGKSVWRSLSRKYIMFYNKSGWVVTESEYESKLSEKSGGYAANRGDNPYKANWNVFCEIEML